MLSRRILKFLLSQDGLFRHLSIAVLVKFLLHVLVFLDTQVYLYIYTYISIDPVFIGVDISQISLTVQKKVLLFTCVSIHLKITNED